MSEPKRIYRQPPRGWFPFGWHVDIPGPLEFSVETDEALMPLWERPATTTAVPAAARDTNRPEGHA